ncbi:hypothetical protein C8R45DRAFT_1216730 [Mycena sanguinolenta]|nr:hypothetical protein C8R45DRAFT_1216730 [Mycena sanguinolenta]
MVERTPSINPGDDEPSFFTVVQPYPGPGADWERDSDYVIACGRWIAACVGDPAPFCAIWIKPNVRFLAPTIFARAAMTRRLVSKGRRQYSSKSKATTRSQSDSWASTDGSKRIRVEDSWFSDLNSFDSVKFVDPYPPAVWCPLPPEDQTNKPMCRTLPIRFKASPAPARVSAPAPDLGSASWVQKKAALPTNGPAVMRRAWPIQTAAAIAPANTISGRGESNGARGGRGKNNHPSSSGWETKARTTRHQDSGGGGSATGEVFNEQRGGGTTKNDGGRKTVRREILRMPLAAAQLFGTNFS